MDKQERIKEIDRLEKVAAIMKDMCKVIPLLGHRVRSLKIQLTQLPSKEKNLIRFQLNIALDEITNMLRKINHNLLGEEKRQVAEFTHP
jgi:hypothetical protein